MAAPSKKRAMDNELHENVEDEASDFDDEDVMEEDDVEEEDMEGQEVQVDFEARNPEDSDFHGIRKLLQQLFLKTNVNISDLSDAIISQSYVGSVIKQCPVDDEDTDEEEEDVSEVFGVISVLNITEKKSMEFVRQLKDLVLTRAKGSGVEHKLQQLLEGDGAIGLLLNERFINIPPQIALPSFESLWKEVERAKQKKMPYDFSNYLMICKTYQAPSPPGHKHSKQPLMFTNSEEELIHQESSLTFDFSVADQRDMTVSGQWDDEETQMEPLRTVMVIGADKIPVIMAKLRSALTS